MASTFDPFCRKFLADPYSQYRILRDEDPCHFVERHNFWVLSRYDDVLAALRAPTVFSSTGGVGPDWQSEPIMSMYDPPEHTRLRRLVAPLFNVAAIEAIGAAAERHVANRIGPALESGCVELVEQFAIPVALDVMADVLGIQPESPNLLRRWADATTDQLAGGLSVERAAEAKTEVHEFVEFCRKMLAEKRFNPEAPGVIGQLLETTSLEIMTRREQLAFCVLLLAAGWGTTAIAISNAVRLLAQFPEQWSLLQNRPSLLSNVGEESIRYDGPIQSFFRNTLAPVTLRDKTIPAGSKVQLIFASANRDERRFPDPDRFDITRDCSGHLGYGFGIHTCLGAPLARIIIGAVIRAFVRHVDTITFSAPVELRPDVIFRTVAALPLSLKPRTEPRGPSIPPPTARRGRGVR